MEEISEYSCRRLWQSVIIAALTDLKFGDYSAFHDAEEWIFSDCSDFRVICDMADIDKSKVMKCAASLVDTRPLFNEVKHKRHYALERQPADRHDIPSEGNVAWKDNEVQIRTAAAERLSMARQAMAAMRI